ncbi:hypothetical protein STEG23_002861 [Scotinomys teguina]
MKTLVLLSALTLLAFSAQADPLPEATEGDKNEEQPGVEDQAVSISFGDPAGSALQDAGNPWPQGPPPLSCPQPPAGLQSQAEPLQRRAEIDLQQLGEDDQDVSMSFGGDEGSALQYAD